MLLKSFSLMGKTLSELLGGCLEFINLSLVGLVLLLKLFDHGIMLTEGLLLCCGGLSLFLDKLGFELFQGLVMCDPRLFEGSV